VLPGLLFSMGVGGALPFKDSIALASDYKATPTLTSFVPVRLMTDEHGHAHAHTFPTRGSGDFISLLGSDGFVELPARERRYEAGSVVSLYRW
jgi:molybdopterin biosynthesis enzyme